jgi:hypothetical protein
MTTVNPAAIFVNIYDILANLGFPAAIFWQS